MLSGTFPYPDVAQHLVDEATRLVINELPEEVIRDLSTELTDPDGTTGVSVAGHRVLSAHKSGYKARRLSADIRARLVEVDDGDPAFYILNETGYVLPDGGTIVTVQYPTVNIDDGDPASLPTDPILDLIVSKASLMCLDYLMQKERTAYSTSITLPSVPTAPTAPTLSYSDVASVAPSAVAIGSLPTAPVYSAATASLGSAPTIATLDLTKKVDGTSITVPTAPSAPEISYSDAAAVAPSATSIAELPTPPSYTPPTYSAATPPEIGDIDLTKKVDGVTALAAPAVPTAPSISYSDAVAAEVAATTIGSMPTPPAYTKLASSLSFTDWDTYFDSASKGEDPEMAAAALSKVRLELDEMRLAVEDEGSEFQKELSVYQQEYRKLIDQAQITLQEAIEDARQAGQISVANERETAATALQNYRLSLDRHASELQLFAAETNLVVSSYAAGLAERVQLFSVEAGTAISLYQAAIQSADIAYRATLDVYNAGVARNQIQAQITAQEAAQTASQATDVAVRNKAESVRATLENYQLLLARFREEMQQYQQHVSTNLQEWQAIASVDIDVWFKERQTDLEKYSSDITNNRSALEASLADYRAGTEKILAQAQISRQEAQQTASQATEIAVVNAAKNLEAAIADFEADLTLFRSSLESFALQAENVFKTQQLTTASVESKLRMMAFDRQRLSQLYQETKRAFIRFNWPNRVYTIKQATI